MRACVDDRWARTDRRDAYASRLRAALAAGLVCALLAAPVRAADESTEDRVIPPGQEALLAAMLGDHVALPDGCTFTSGQVDGGLLVATYRCPRGDVVFELTHPRYAGETAVQTERFAIAPRSGTPPEALLDVVASLVRSREAEFEWLAPADQRTRDTAAADAP